MLQVLTVRACEQGFPAWHADVPLTSDRGLDNLSLIIRRERRRGGAGDAQPVWSVEIEFQPPGLGEIHARIALAPDGLVATLSTPDSATFDRLNAAIEQLSERFFAAGLAVDRVGCRCAAPDATSAADLPHGLVSTVA